MTLSIKKTLSIAAIAMTAMFSSATATAGLIVTTPVQTQTFSFADLISGAQLLAFNGFDSTLGTLTSVTMSWSLNQTLNNTASNNSAAIQAVGTPTPLTATATTTFNGTGIATALTSTNTLTTPGFTGSVAAGTAYTVGAPPVIVIVPTLSTVGTATITGITGSSILSTGLAGYIGGLNLFNISVNSSGTQGGSVNALVTTGNNGTASGFVNLFYTYNEVPTPGTIALLGLGLLGLAVMRRKAMF